MYDFLPKHGKLYIKLQKNTNINYYFLNFRTLRTLPTATRTATPTSSHVSHFCFFRGRKLRILTRQIYAPCTRNTHFPPSPHPRKLMKYACKWRGECCASVCCLLALSAAAAAKRGANGRGVGRGGEKRIGGEACNCGGEKFTIKILGSASNNVISDILVLNNSFEQSLLCERD